MSYNFFKGNIYNTTTGDNCGNLDDKLAHIQIYRHIFSIRRTKYQNLTASRLV